MIIQCPKTGRTCDVTGCTGCWTTEREWVDLTDDEILMCVKSQSIIETVRRAIHALKEKNK